MFSKSWRTDMLCCCRRSGKSTEVKKKILIVFEFDNTIIDVNSDDFILRMLPDRGKDLQKLKTMIPWTDYMQNVFQEIHDNGNNAEDFQMCAEEIPFTAGMKELIIELKQQGHEIIIISDSNSFFIKHSLRKAGLYCHISKIFTNPAEIDSKGCLRISMYQYQKTCTISAVNLCKGTILEEYIRQREREGQTFPFVVYVGDGSKDYCPVLRLREKDVVFPRVNYSLDKILKREADNSANKTKAKIIPWDTGYQIMDDIFQIIKHS